MRGRAGCCIHFRPPRLDHTIDHLIEPLLRRPESPHLRQRPIEQQFGSRQGDEEVVQVHDDVDLVVDVVDLWRNLHIEERASDYLQSEPHHLP